MIAFYAVQVATRRIQKVHTWKLIKGFIQVCLNSDYYITISIFYFPWYYYSVHKDEEIEQIVIQI